MFRKLLSLILFSFFVMTVACGGDRKGNGDSAATTGGGDSPTAAYKRVFDAVKSKDTEAIKKEMSKKTIEFGKMAAAKNETPVEKMYENGFTGTTFSDTMPEIRDERIKEKMGSVEVWNEKDSKWEDIPFINEDGVWKLAFGDLFAGSFVSPGHGRDRREREAANTNSSTTVQPASNTNSNIAKPKITDGPKPPETPGNQ